MGLNFFGLGDSEVSNVAIPEWEEDPFYKRTQDVLAPFGENLLSGDIPDYYSAIGDIGGKAFEDMLKLNVRDVNKSIDESSALQGIRGPRSAAIKASSISDLTKKMRYEDMLRGVEGKKFLMGSGLNTLSGVRGSSLDWMGMKNPFELQRAGMEMDKAEYTDSWNKEQNAIEGELFSKGLGIALAPFTGGASLGMSSMGSLGKSGGTTASTGMGGGIGDFFPSYLN